MGLKGHHMSEGEDSSLPIRNEAACHHHSRVHSDPHWDLLDGKWVRFAKNRRGISQSSLSHFRKESFHVRAGTRHNQGEGERAREMVELGYLTSTQITRAHKNAMRSQRPWAGERAPTV